jgi:putative membrane protein
MSAPRRREPVVLLALAAVALAVSAIRPYRYDAWLFEVALVYRLVFGHALILMLGAHYTYADVPLGEWARDWFGFARNHYDRVGHFAQGFVPAIIVREILLRRTPLRAGRWLFALVSCVCLAISACWEFGEWWATLLKGEGPDAILSSQGDVWDTQWDMLLALIGAVMSQLLLGRVHDRELRQF